MEGRREEERTEERDGEKARLNIDFMSKTGSSFDLDGDISR